MNIKLTFIVLSSHYNLLLGFNATVNNMIGLRVNFMVFNVIFNNMIELGLWLGWLTPLSTTLFGYG
jgi:hypothetical protein